MTAEQVVKDIAFLYRVREETKGLLGDSYVARMAEWSEAIHAIARANGCSELAAAIDMASKDLPMAPFILAAAVELIHPSSTEVNR